MTPSPHASKIGIALLAASSWFFSGCATPEDEVTDVGTSSDAILGNFLPKGPLTDAPAGQWTWVDIPGSECANGTTTGLGINMGDDKGDILVQFDGGGACWDEVSCLQLRTAGLIDSYQSDTFALWRQYYAPGMETDGPWDRTQAKNPFRKSTYIYVPYCTADLHSGDAVQQLSTRAMHYSGRKNAAVFVDAIRRSFPLARHLTVSGTSAGAIGATVNYWRFNRAYPLSRIDLINDSGPTIDQTTIPLLAAWDAAWNFKGALPPHCEECKTNIDAIIPFYAKWNPLSRFAQLAYDNDPTLQFFYTQSPAAYAANVKAYTEGKLAPLPNARYFVAPRVRHGMFSTFNETSQGAVLADWLTTMHDGSRSRWKSVSSL